MLVLVLALAFVLAVSARLAVEVRPHHSASTAGSSESPAFSRPHHRLV
jgi:hypothetical protein